MHSLCFRYRVAGTTAPARPPNISSERDISLGQLPPQQASVDNGSVSPPEQPRSTGAPAPELANRARGLIGWIPALLLSATVLSQIVWVLLPAQWRDAATVTSVLLLFGTSTSHAAITRGWRWTGGYLLITLSIGWLVEAFGTSTGVLFGDYQYADSLGWKLGPVPFAIPLAWAMMAYPVLLAVRKVSPRRAMDPFWAAAVMVAWDLFLDPQMVAEGHWVWTDPEPALPGIPGIPMQNYLGWYLTALLMMALLTVLDARRQPSTLRTDVVPTLALGWVFASNVLAAAAFFGRPLVALWGGVVMGLLLLPWLLRVLGPTLTLVAREPRALVRFDDQADRMVQTPEGSHG